MRARVCIMEDEEFRIVADEIIILTEGLHGVEKQDRRQLSLLGGVRFPPNHQSSRRCLLTRGSKGPVCLCYAMTGPIS